MNKIKRTPRILYVTETLPQKGSFGGEIRCMQIARALSEIGSVEVAMLQNEDMSGTGLDGIECEFPLRCLITAKHGLRKGMFQKLQWTFDPRSDYPYGSCVDLDIWHRHRNDFEKYDLIWFFKLRAAEMFPNTIWPRSVLDIDDLPTTYESATLQTERGARERLMALRSLFSWRRREALLGKRFTVLSVCSEEDRQYLQALDPVTPIHVIPNGFARPLQRPSRCPSAPPRLGFVGLLDFFPNRDGLQWFVNRCWPSIKRRIPNARFRLIGRDSSGTFDSLHGDIDRLGWLDDTSEEIKTWSVMVVPIRVGAGTRIKIAHGFSQGCPIVSTTFGAYGYGAVNGREMYLADRPEDFADACIRAISEPDAAARMADAAWRMFLEKWTWESIRPRIWATAEECLQKSFSVAS
jgi:glycosyltransferase involved in cell wall biosynthesis